MLIMIANNTGREARRLLSTYPDRVGHIMGPGGWRAPIAPYALDNGAFPAFTRGLDWNAEAFYGLCDRAAAAPVAPRWVAVPDVVLDRDATLARWAAHAPGVRARFGWPLAFVVQNGMTAADVPPDADVVFVGGDTAWKWETAAYWCGQFPRVHIGRVNTERLLWLADRAGAESCDGSGWFRGNRKQLDGLWYYLADSSAHGEDESHGPMQPRLFTQGAA